MAYCEAMAETMRADLGVEPGLTEKRMFGGLGFMLHGHMVSGIMGERGMFRVGKSNEGAALQKGADAFTVKGRRMGGMVVLDAGAFETMPDLRRWLIARALGHVATLPPKEGR
jgi:TfoX/Sxy family transcriptional regulator of competence genes